MFTRETGMIGLIIGKWMVGFDWNSGLSLFVFDMDMDDEVFTKKLF
jgi:hypothetical protein